MAMCHRFDIRFIMIISLTLLSFIALIYVLGIA